MIRFNRFLKFVQKYPRSILIIKFVHLRISESVKNPELVSDRACFLRNNNLLLIDRNHSIMLFGGLVQSDDIDMLLHSTDGFYEYSIGEAEIDKF